MISARSMCRDASAAKRIISTAPIAKLGATNAFALARRGLARSAVEVEARVPITTCTPAASAARALSSAVSGRVKSTTTSAAVEHVGDRATPRAGSARPVSSRSSAASTAAHTVCPMRPAAPATAPRGSCRDGSAAGQTGSTAARNASSSGPMPAADSRSGAHSSSTSSRRSSIVHGVEARHHLVGLQQRQAVQRRRAEPVHARAGGLEREHDARLDVLARAPSSSSVAGCSRRRASSASTTSIASARLSGRVPT